VSGLIYAVIVAVWLAVLIPIWLRRHDDAAVTRSADRYTRAMRTLSRRPTTVGSREIVLPPRPQVALATVSGTVSGAASGTAAAAASGGAAGSLTVPVGGPGAARPREVASTASSSTARRRPDRRTRAAAAGLARRRARTLLVLLGLTLVVLVLGLLGRVPLSVTAVPGLLVVAFLVHLRLQARRAAQRRRGGATRDVAKPDVPASARGDRRRAAPVPQPAPDHRSRAVVLESKNEGTLGRPSEAEASRPLAAEGADASTAAEGYAASGDVGHDELDDEEWRPQSWPLPTYVTKPKAVRPVRVIDLTTPGAWTSGRLLDDEAEPVEEVMAAAEETTLELDAIVERAVND
jgi:hypothetical protein